MFVGHTGGSEEADAGGTGFPCTVDSLGNLRGEQAGTFRVDDVGLMLPVMADEEAADDGPFRALHFLLRDGADP